MSHALVAGFHSELDVRRRREDGRWVLLAPLKFFSAKTGKLYEVPVGFDTDFASVPRLPLTYYLMGSYVFEEGVLHDWLFRTGVEPFEVCNEIFLEAMETLEVSGWRRKTMKLGVDWFGRRHYKQVVKTEPAWEGDVVQKAPPEEPTPPADD